jgi:hypothetical protein
MMELKTQSYCFKYFEYKPKLNQKNINSYVLMTF